MTEVKHILAAAGIFFAVELSYYGFFIAQPTYLLAILLGVFSAFLIHESAHKLLAQNYGYWAEFRLNRMGAILSMISIVSPLKIIAPGAVMIYGQFTAREDIGKIAAVGPLTNILQSLSGMIVYALPLPSMITLYSFMLASINADLALFNLLPFSIIDGRKILDWNRRVWLLLFASAITFWVYARFL